MTDELKRRCRKLIDEYHDVDDPEPWMTDALNALAGVLETPDAPAVDPESVGWLRTLIGSYRELRENLTLEGCADEDESATAEMLDAVSRLADALDPPRPPERDRTDPWVPDDRPGPDDPPIPF